LDIPELAAGEGVGEDAMSFVSFLKFGFLRRICRATAYSDLAKKERKLSYPKASQNFAKR
jgi:hypothetical protein